MVVHLQVSDGGIGQRRHWLDLFVHLFVFVSSCFLVGYCCKLFGLLFWLVVESACSGAEVIFHFLQGS